MAHVLQEIAIDSGGNGDGLGAGDTVFTLSLANVADGSTLLLQLNSGSSLGIGIFDVEDNVAGDWIEDIDLSTVDPTATTYYSKAVWRVKRTAGGNVTVTFTCPFAPDTEGLGASLHECTALGDLDQASFNTGTGTTLSSPTLPTLAETGEFIFVTGLIDGESPSSTPSNPPWITDFGAEVFEDNAAPLAWQVASSTTAPVASWTIPSAAWWALAVAYPDDAPDDTGGGGGSGGGGGAVLPTGYASNGLGSSWVMALDDEFDGTALDTSKWSVGALFNGGSGAGGIGNLSPSGSQQSNVYFGAGSVVVSGGKVYLRKQPATGGPYTLNGVSTTPDGVFASCHIESGSITTAGLWTLNPRNITGRPTRYGTPIDGGASNTIFVEIAGTFPDGATGDWPVFWSTNDGNFLEPFEPYSEENDYAEFPDGEFRLHAASEYDTGTSVSGEPSSTSPSGEHTYGYEIHCGSATDSYMKVFYDGVHVPAINPSAAQVWAQFAKPQFLMLSFQTNNSAIPSAVEDFPVDYMRVWVAGTSGAPIASTSAAASLTETSETLNGLVNPNGSDTTVHFEYGLTNAYGQSTAPQDAGSGGANVSVSAEVDALTPNTTYHYRVVATSSQGTVNGADQTFTTTGVAPALTVASPTSLAPTSVTLNASVNPNGADTAVKFQYGASSPTYGTDTGTVDAGAGVTKVTVSKTITGLTAGHTYHFRAVATSSSGTTDGSDQTVTLPTASAPTATTAAASAVDPTTATLNAAVTPNFADAAVTFQYGLTDSYGTTTASQDAGAGGTPVALAAALTGLEPDTTYHYRVVATNSVGTTDGSDRTFTTPPAPIETATPQLIMANRAVGLLGFMDLDDA